MPLNDILCEMNAFVKGRANRFASVLSSASTDEINALNAHLLEVLGNSQDLSERVEAQEQAVINPLPDLNGIQSAAENAQDSDFLGFLDEVKDKDTTHWPLPPLDGEWSALSLPDLAAMKSQIDQQLATVRIQLQAFFGPLTDEMVSPAAIELNGLSVLDLIGGAKHTTSSLMELLSAHQGSESSLVDDVLLSMTEAMDSESLVTTDDPLEDLIKALQLDALQQAEVHPAGDKNFENPGEPVRSSMPK